MIGQILGTLVAPVAGIFREREKRKVAKVVAEGKLAEAKLHNAGMVTMTDQEWESISARGLNDTWKDEYVTIVITSPIVMLLTGGVWQAFTGDPRLLEGVMNGIASLSMLGVDFGFLMTTVVLAAVGLKAWRNIR